MKFLCTKDFEMEDGDIAFTAGNIYDFKLDNGSWLTIDDQDDKHWMENEDLVALTS